MSNRSASPYQNCARIYLRGMASLLQSLFEAVDNALFEMAEKADSNNLQTQYFDGMRQVRKTRSTVENAILKSLRTSLIDFHNGTRPETHGPEPEHTEDTLSLVDEADLEQNLAISEMVAKGENRLSRQLFALAQRLGACVERTPPDDSFNPMGPAVICQAIRDSGPLFEVELPVLLVIYKLFDRNVLEHLGSLYTQINDGLMADGILPNLQHAVPRRSATPGFAAGAGGSSAPDGPVEAANEQQPEGMPGDPEYPPGTEPQAETQLLNSILSLLSARRGQQASGAAMPDQPGIVPESLPGSAPSRAPTTPVKTEQLLNALTVLQASAASNDAESPASPIKQQVLSEMDRMTGESSASNDDEDTIDLVAMLFEFILSDENLPQPMQVLLARLQIPYIKVALMDRHLFASRRHPARRLLDRMADLALGWSPEADRGNRLYDFMASIIDRVNDEFDDNLELFDELRGELKRFVNRWQRRAQIAEKRTTETAEGQQRLQLARHTAQNIIRSHLGERELPRIIEEILGKPWANVLVLTFLRHGESSSQFESAVSFVDRMIWSIEPKTTAEEVAQLQAELPDISNQLRAGLDMVAYHDDDIRKVFRRLKELYRSMLSTQYQDQLDLPSPTPPPTMSLPAAVAPVQLPISGAAELADDVFEDLNSEPEPVPLEALEAALREQVDSLEVGTWFQFTSDDGETLRAKLSWKSPITGKFLFVDQKGIKISDKPVAELAQELANGEVVALETVPLFDRALEAIAGRLGADQPAEGATP